MEHDENRKAARYFYFLDRFDEKYHIDQKLFQSELIRNEWYPIVSSDVGIDINEFSDIEMDEDTKKQWCSYLERRIVTSPSILSYQMHFSRIINDLFNNQQILCKFSDVSQFSMIVNSKSMLQEYYIFSLPLGIIDLIGNYTGYNTWKSLNGPSPTVTIQNENNSNYSLIKQFQVFDSARIKRIEQLYIDNPNNLNEYNIQTYIVNNWSFDSVATYICRIGGNLYSYTSYFGFVTPKYINLYKDNSTAIIGYDLEGYSLSFRLLHAYNWTVIYKGKEVLKYKPNFIVQGSWTTMMIQINKLNDTIKFVFGKGDMHMEFDIKKIATSFFEHISTHDQPITLGVTSKIKKIWCGEWGCHLIHYFNWKFN